MIQMDGHYVTAEYNKSHGVDTQGSLEAASRSA